MSRITRNHLTRAVAVAALLAVGSLIRPEIGLAQANGPEQAFLNRTPAGPGLTLGFSAYPTPYTGSPADIELSGERALLGRTEDFRVWVLELGQAPAVSAVEVTRIDGYRALLGRSE
jgi:hypothetical protein